MINIKPESIKEMKNHIKADSFVLMPQHIIQKAKVTKLSHKEYLVIPDMFSNLKSVLDKNNEDFKHTPKTDESPETLQFQQNDQIITFTIPNDPHSFEIYREIEKEIMCWRLEKIMRVANLSNEDMNTFINYLYKIFKIKLGL